MVALAREEVVEDDVADRAAAVFFRGAAAGFRAPAWTRVETVAFLAAGFLAAVFVAAPFFAAAFVVFAAVDVAFVAAAVGRVVVREVLASTGARNWPV